jgi:hypothetical protein
MRSREARGILQSFKNRATDANRFPIPAYAFVEALEKAEDLLAEAEKREEADGCQGCEFTDVEEWEMPCAKCKRACKDYWRPAK